MTEMSVSGCYKSCPACSLPRRDLREGTQLVCDVAFLYMELRAKILVLRDLDVLLKATLIRDTDARSGVCRLAGCQSERVERGGPELGRLQPEVPRFLIRFDIN